MSQVLFGIPAQDKENSFVSPHASEGPFLVSHLNSYGFGTPANNSGWQFPENVKYVLFIELHRAAMEGKEHNKLWSVYKAMARYIKSRNYLQCKLYHQKMLSKHKSIAGIISYLMESYPEFQEAMEREKTIIRKINFSEARKQGLDDKWPTGLLYYIELEHSEEVEAMPESPIDK